MIGQILVAIVLSTCLYILILKIFGEGGILSHKKHLQKRISQNQEPSIAKKPIFSSEGLKKKHFISDIPLFQRILNGVKFTNVLASMLEKAKFNVSVSAFFLFSATLGILVYFILQVASLGPVLGILAGAASFFCPFLYLVYLRKQYLDRFVQNLPDSITILSGSLKVGYGVETALEALSNSGPQPVADEFRVVKNEIILGSTLDTSLIHLYERIKTPEVKILVTGMIINQQVGGNLSELLDSLEKTIRERFALRREISALSSQGLASLVVLFSLPIVTFLMQYSTDKVGMTEFITSGMGRACLIVMAIMQGLGFFFVKKVINLTD